MKSCNEKLQDLSGFYICMYEGDALSPYILVTNLDATVWRVLQQICAKHIQYYEHICLYLEQYILKIDTKL